VLWSIALAVCLGGCVPTRSPGWSPSSQYGDPSLIGLVLAEKVSLHVQPRASVGLVLTPSAEARYQALIQPGDVRVTFRRQGRGDVYLAWAPAGEVEAGEVTVLLLGHEADAPGTDLNIVWPESRAPRLTGRVEPGRVTYLGRVRRDVYYRPASKTDQAAAAWDMAVESEPDPGGRAIEGLCLDYPWLRDSLLNPPSRPGS
ncbi:MAG: hypothetical protein KKB20_10255, partial [Proteobacteria bacterium]|nr:hypothetical protein [Pseudomonadota bacterium]